LIEDELLLIKEQGSFEAFNLACDGIEFGGFQSVSILLWLYAKRGGFIFDPGMGKTLTIAGALKMLFVSDKDSKCLFFIKKIQLDQTSADIRNYAGLRVVTTTAESKSLRSKVYWKNFESFDVLMVTQETLDSAEFMVFLYENLKRFNVCVVDEAHYLLDYKESDRALMLESILPRFERVALLTATPLVSRYEQFAYFLYLIDHKKFANVKKLVKQMEEGSRIDVLFPLSVYNYDRAGLGIANTYNSIPVWVEPHDWQVGLFGDNVLRKTRGEGSYNQVAELIRLLKVQKSRGRRGLVFCYYHSSREWLLPFLDESGLKYGCIHGGTGVSERTEVQRAFNLGELDVVVLSISEAMNLDSDFVFFYQYTVNVKQVVGRVERGLNPKVIDLFFMFTRLTGEVDYFLENIYKRAEYVRNAIGKEYSEFLSLGESVM
jgi:hypothetical protein